MSYALALINFDRADHEWGKNDGYGTASPRGWKGHGRVVLTQDGEVYTTLCSTLADRRPLPRPALLAKWMNEAHCDSRRSYILFHTKGTAL